MISKNSLAKIHIAKSQLGMDDDTYRLVLRTHGGVDSAKELSLVGAAKVLAHMERCGFKVKTGGKDIGKRPKPAKGRAALVRKVEAQLADAGRPWSYVDGMAKRMFKVDKFDWLDAEQIGKIIAALSYDAKRRETAVQAAEESVNECAN